MALAWQDATAAEQARAFGPPALIAPPPQRLGIAGSSDGHLPPDAQRQFCHGRALSLLPAARLGQATALANVSTGAEATGAGLLGDVPAASRNDDRLGRAPDAFFTQRHPILATVAAEALRRAERAPQRPHCDATHLIFHGACEAPQPRPDDTPGPPRSSADVPPAPLTHGYAAAAKLLHVGIPAAVDRRGALPILGQCLDGNPNNHTAVRQQPGWLPGQGLLAPAALPVSDRGTFSVEHVARRHRRGCPVLCSAPWAD